ncbi:K+/H+ antiporter [Propionigenium maris DSM 9537]|uniref:K+/H+ antiporter n=1 Tax=Propionigenium maris DSM 9537 TaxID=1123000 RepID=A0A9W6GKJ3_9FUSO|nr:potassium/proton antiporter [Propionigenium maris]GLI55496.1 K+/H+ antiporter [Propionigenium maris DSM 9537]
MTIEKVCIILGVLILSSIFSLKLSKKFNIPTLIIYLGIGMLAGSEGIGGIAFDNAPLAQFIGSLALCIILFSGAFNTNIGEIRDIKKEGLALAVIGVFLNTLFVAVPIYFFTPFEFLQALLFGAIVSSTDASAVMSIIGFSGLNIRKKVGGILKLESGTNDPMANVLIILLLGVISSGRFSFPRAVLFLIAQVGLGILCGYLIFRLALLVLERFELKMQELHQLIIVGFLLTTYGLTNLVGGNGFMAIYILGLSLGNSPLRYRKNMNRFFSSLSWFVEVGMFVMLGLLVFPMQLMEIWRVGVLVSIVLIFLARPLSVFLTLMGSRVENREKLFISWGGLKGAVPIIFATFPLIEGVENSELIFNLVFFVVVISVIFQGVTLPFMSWYLGLESHEESPFQEGDLEKMEYLEERVVKIRVSSEGILAGRRVHELNLPREILLILINRQGDNLLPRGNTLIREEDELYLLSDNLHTVRSYFSHTEDIVN